MVSMLREYCLSRVPPNEATIKKGRWPANKPVSTPTLRNIYKLKYPINIFKICITRPPSALHTEEGRSGLTHKRPQVLIRAGLCAFKDPDKESRLSVDKKISVLILKGSFSTTHELNRYHSNWNTSGGWFCNRTYNDRIQIMVRLIISLDLSKQSEYIFEGRPFAKESYKNLKELVAQMTKKLCFTVCNIVRKYQHWNPSWWESLCENRY